MVTAQQSQDTMGRMKQVEVGGVIEQSCRYEYCIISSWHDGKLHFPSRAVGTDNMVRYDNHCIRLY